MKRTLAAALLVFIATPLFAVEDAHERERLVAELLKLMDAPTFHRAVADAILGGFTRGGGSDEEREQARAYFDRVLGRVDFAAMVQDVDAPLLGKTFTTDELHDLIAFLKTKSGQKLMRIMPEMTAGALLQSSKAIQGAAQQVDEEKRSEDRKKYPWKVVMADIRTIATASEAYATDENHYPKATTMEELRKLLEPIYVRTLPLKDAWGHDYVYRVSPDGQHYRIVSGGADGHIDFTNETIVDIPQNAPIRPSKSPDEDIVYQDGQFLQAPEEALKEMRQP
jgi:hypothetical protein